MNLAPQCPEGVRRRLEVFLQVNQRTAVFRQITVDPLEYVVGEYKQLVTVILWIVFRQKIEGKEKFDVLHHKDRIG